MTNKRVDGLVVAPSSRLDYDHLAAARASAELVLLDRHLPDLPVDSVLVDNRKGADVGVSHVIACGHRRIALVTGASPGDWAGSDGRVGRHLMSTGRERIQGYRLALRRAGIPVDPAYVRLGDFHREAAGQMALDLLELPEPPTAIFCTDSVITLGVLEALQRAGVKMPEQMSVLGFDDPDWSEVVRPTLTVVNQPVYDLGALAARRVIARIRGDESRPRPHRLPTTLLVRESVTAPS
jgi:LacI family transcriptional regulator